MNPNAVESGAKRREKREERRYSREERREKGLESRDKDRDRYMDTHTCIRRRNSAYTLKVTPSNHLGSISFPFHS